jgi:hypothetical protein
MDKLMTLQFVWQSVADWCAEVIKEQEEYNRTEGYHSLTSPRDLNHVVKSAVQQIMEYMKQNGFASPNDPEPNPQKEKLKFALSTLLAYLRKNEVWKPSKQPPLSEDELDVAFKEMYVSQYARVDRKFSDPEIRGQNYAIYSFNPTKGAQCDSDGLYGFIKVRGVFGRLEQAEEKARDLIKYFSANKIFVAEVGNPTPLQNALSNGEHVEEVENTDSENMGKFAEIIKEQSMQEKKVIEEIKQREEELRKDVEKTPEDRDPLDYYIQLTQKRAEACYVYKQHLAHLAQYKKTIISVRRELAQMDVKYPELQYQFLEHYRKKTSESGIDKAVDNMAMYIKNYIGKDDDPEVQFEDEEDSSGDVTQPSKQPHESEVIALARGGVI